MCHGRTGRATLGCVRMIMQLYCRRDAKLLILVSSKLNVRLYIGGVSNWDWRHDEREETQTARGYGERRTDTRVARHVAHVHVVR